MLKKKMIRDLKEHKGAYFASIVILFLGIMIFIAFSLAVDNLKLSQEIFYNEKNFADGFVKVKALPFDKLKNLEKIDGLSQIEGRLVYDVQVYAPEKAQNIYLRLISINPKNPNPINGIEFDQQLSIKDLGMVVTLDSNFLAANNLEVNDKLSIIAEGSLHTLNIGAVGISPEFIYALRTSSDIYPSPETFGIAFVPMDIMLSFFPEQRIYNDLIFKLTPGTEYETVREEIENYLQPYGLISIFARDDQTSHLLLTTEIKSIQTMAFSFPFIFLSIAAMILYITLKRLVEQQRGQIGILKAFGYTPSEILLHYLSYALLIAIAGSVLGGLLGIIISYPLIDFYRLFFNMPIYYEQFSWSYFLSGIVLSIFFALFAGYQGCKNALKLEPAEAMRPPAPIIGKKIWLEKIPALWKRLNVQSMMALRNLSRNKGRSLFIFLGILFCFAISGFTWSMNDIIQKMLFDQYEMVELYDLKITTIFPHDAKKVILELKKFPGVHKVEPLAEIPVKLQNNWLEQNLVLMGISGESELYNILDKDYNKVPPPSNGLLLSERLARLLDAPIDTELVLTNLLPGSKEDKFALKVVGIIPQYLGSNAYLEIGALQDLFREKNLSTSFMLTLEQDSIAALKEKYRNSQAIKSIDERLQRLAKFEEMMATTGSMIYVFAIFGVIIGFAIIYSSSIITLSERNRELASMLVLGMTPKEVLAVITWEQWLAALPAMLLGIPVSQAFISVLAQAISTDLYTMPDTLTASSFLIALIFTTISIWIAQQAAARKIKTLSLVEVLKSQE